MDFVCRRQVFDHTHQHALSLRVRFGPDAAGLRVIVARTGIGSQVNVVVGAGRSLPGLVKVYPGSSFAVGSTTEPAGGMLLTPFGSEVLTDGVFVG